MVPVVDIQFMQWSVADEAYSQQTWYYQTKDHHLLALPIGMSSESLSGLVILIFLEAAKCQLGHCFVCSLIAWQSTL